MKLWGKLPHHPASMSNDTPHVSAEHSQPPHAPTHYAIGERLSREKILQQASIIDDSPLAAALINGGMNCSVILNQYRQIVAASRNILEITAARTLDELLGKRPGEAFACIHSEKSESGCGTSEFCRECGALKAILEGLSGARSVQECRMTRVHKGVEESLDLQILATPLEYQGTRYTLLAIHDISHEKRRRALERIFFHDVINLAGGMEGLLFNLKENVPPELKREMDLSYATIREMIEEIITQRDLVAAEQNELPVCPTVVNSLKLLRRIAAVYENHPVTESKSIFLSPSCVSDDFSTDSTLFRRVMGNLIKNAAEACKPGDIIFLSSELQDGRIVFKINNPQVMSIPVQHQIFQRSFSTKGLGRGLGTYSVRLIGERFLKGKVSFTSSEGQGTTFQISLPLSLQ